MGPRESRDLPMSGVLHGNNGILFLDGGDGARRGGQQTIAMGEGQEERFTGIFDGRV